jgi:hypothetical protein
VAKSTRANTSRKRAREARDHDEYARGEDNEVEEIEEAEDEDENVEEEAAGAVKPSSKKSFSCPFSGAREGARTFCKWRPHVDKRSVRFLWTAFANWSVVGKASSRDSLLRLNWRNKIRNWI